MYKTMDRLFRGIIKYRNTEKVAMVEQFKEVKNNPIVSPDNMFLQ